MNEAPLPQALRQDLRLYASGPGADGGPSWAIQDPVSNRFFRIGWLEYECLLRWPGKPDEIAAAIEKAGEISHLLSLHRQWRAGLRRHPPASAAPCT